MSPIVLFFNVLFQLNFTFIYNTFSKKFLISTKEVDFKWTFCTFWYYSWVPLYYFSLLLPLSTVFLAKSFQFQQNKRISNGHFVLFGIIHRSYYTILTYFYLYLQHFQQKVFSFNKISRSQMDTKHP